MHGSCRPCLKYVRWDYSRCLHMRNGMNVYIKKRLEAGDGNPRLDTLVRIVKCLKTDLNSVVPQEHLCKDSGIWQIVRKLLSMDKKKMDKAIKAILAMLDAMSDD